MTAPDSAPPFDETPALKALQRDARALAKHLELLAKLKPGDATALDSLEHTLASLPSSADFAAALEELRTRAADVLATAKSQRADSFRRVEADFIFGRRDAGVSVREAGNAAWRVGRIELEVQRERARARALYNREVVVPWTAIASTEDFTRLVSEAEKRLTEAALPEDLLHKVFRDAYDHLARRAVHQNTSAVRIPLGDFYREVRVAIARHELSAGKPDRKLARAEFPRWAFLHNLDRYRRLASSLDESQRLLLETGSQHDHQKGMAMVVNGLEATDDYRSYCYVYAAGQTG